MIVGVLTEVNVGREDSGYYGSGDCDDSGDVAVMTAVN